jgi:hypothetical protein
MFIESTQRLHLRLLIRLLLGILLGLGLGYGLARAGVRSVRAPAAPRSAARQRVVVDRVEGDWLLLEAADGVTYPLPMGLPFLAGLREGDVAWVVVYRDRQAAEERLRRAEMLLTRLLER